MFVCFLCTYFIGNYDEDYYNCDTNFCEFSLEEVMPLVGSNEAVFFTVDPIYYKIITMEHPSVHPYKCNLQWSEEKHKYVIKEHVYPYTNFYFCPYEELFGTLKLNAIYVVSKSKLTYIEHWFDDSHVKIETKHYIIFKPTKKT